jgi:hypothetical protein
MFGWIKKAARSVAKTTTSVAKTVAKTTAKTAKTVAKTTAKVAAKGANMAKDQAVGAANNVKDGAEKMGTSVAKGDIKGVAEGAMQVKKGADMVNPKAVATNIAVNEVKKQIKK